MSQKNNDSIEDFFRKAVRQDDDIAFRESDWKNMEKMLDEHSMTDAKAVNRSMRRIAGAATVLVLLFGLSIYLVVFRNADKSTSPVTTETIVTDQQSPSGESLKEKNTISELQNKPVDEISANDSRDQKAISDQSPAIEMIVPTEKDRIASSSQNDITTERASKNAGTSNDIHSSGSDPSVSSPVVGTTEKSSTFNSALKSSAGDSSSSSIVNSFTAVEPDKTADQGNKTNVSVVQPVEPEPSDEDDQTDALASQPTGSTIAPLVSENSQVEKPAAPSDMVTTDSSKNEVSAEASLGAVPEEEDKQEEEKEENVSNKRWSIGVVLAPDFSLTGGARVTTPGEAFGFLLGYRITKRFTLSTGLLSTSKKYVGTGEDYHPPKGYWRNRTNGIIPSEIYGECAVLEIPVWVQFDLKQEPKYRIYLTGGASSYRMLSESYRYTFDRPNDGAERGWSSSEPSSYMFAVGHLSAGYERNVFRRFSLGLEPYVKKPFGGIGWSDVQLFTWGVYVNGRYRF